MVRPVLASFVGSDSWFAVLMTIHGVGAVMGLGPTFAFGILAALGKKASPEGGLAILEGILSIDEKIVNPILLTTQPLTGALMIWNRGLNNNFFSGHHLWLIIGILAYLIATIVALTIMDPSIKQMIAMARGGQAETPAFGALAAKLNRFGPILTILGVVIIVMMVWKPGSGCGSLLRC